MSLQQITREVVPPLSAASRSVGVAPQERVADRVSEVLGRLSQEGYLRLEPERVELTKAGLESISDQSGAARRFGEQFTASLRDRANADLPDDDEGAARVAIAAETFFKDCLQRRALGVALTLGGRGAGTAAFHMVALLQSLPEYMPQLRSNQEAIALCTLVEAVLASPSAAEERFLGLALQAQFGVHILGYDPDTLKARLRDFAGTVFIMDAHSLIPLLARGSHGHDTHRLLVTKLQGLGARLVTTPALVIEIAEHASWALKRVDPIEGSLTVETLKAALGAEGEKTNAFLDGYINLASTGDVRGDLFTYVRSLFGGLAARDRCSSADVRRALAGARVEIFEPRELSGYDEPKELLVQQNAERIREARVARGSFTHQRQADAEAEVLVAVQGIRARELRVGTQDATNAFFVSASRVVDDVVDPQVPVTIHPDALLQWSATLSGCDVEELRSLTDGLLWELADRGLAIVDKTRVRRVFAGLIDGSGERFEEEVMNHRQLIADKYGEDGLRAFEDSVGSVEAPIIFEGYFAQKAAVLEAALAKEQDRTTQVLAQSRLDHKQREQLEILKAQAASRRKKAQARTRAVKSKQGRKGRRGKAR
jgi:hypothetical protein